jgi:CRP-like cAMP-binding protein
VYEEGDLANKIYFIHSGEIEMSRHESKLSEIVS